MRQLVVGAFVGFSLLAATAPASADILDVAIEVIKPELKPAKPVLICAIGGKSVLECAKAEGKSALANEPRVQDILEAYGYANRSEWAKLVAKVGVTAACTAFDIPAKDIVCDEYAKYVVKYGAKIIEAHAAVAQDVGSAVASFVKDGAALLTCAVGFSCPSSAADPNLYVVTMPDGGKYALSKFNLDWMWSSCYATRIEEGVSARISDPALFKRMVAAPSTRRAKSTVMDEDALGSACIVKLEADQGLDYYERLQGIYARGWDPYAAQMNPKWRDMIFAATAETLSTPADLFLKSSDNWMQLRSVVVAQDKWDTPLLKTVYQREVAECIRAVEMPATAVAMWSSNAAETGDSTLLEDVPAGEWAGRIRDWCSRVYQPALVGKIEARRQARARAISGGCTQRPDGGLSCPASGGSDALGQCNLAYSGRGGACSAYVPRIGSGAPALPNAVAPPAAPGRTVIVPRGLPAPSPEQPPATSPSPPAVLPKTRPRIPPQPSSGGG
ncbi:MAG: hypothetical protein ABL956_01665 [Hyphomonadaceae bacterium]